MILKGCGEHLGVTKESCWLNPETRCLDSDYLYSLHCFHSSTTTATAYSASSTVFWLALTSAYGPLWTQEQKHPFCFNTVFIFSADISVTHLSLFCSFHFTYTSFLKDPWTYRTALLKCGSLSFPHICHLLMMTNLPWVPDCPDLISLLL